MPPKIRELKARLQRAGFVSRTGRAVILSGAIHSCLYGLPCQERMEMTQKPTRSGTFRTR